MPASPEQIRTTVQRYVDLVASGTAADIVALYADGAVVEDPVGSTPLTTREEITAFYANLEGLDQRSTLNSIRISGGQAAFLFELVTITSSATYTLAPIDVMTFDDSGLITGMRAYWSDADLVVGSVD